MTEQTTQDVEPAGRWIECGACHNGLVEVWGGGPAECSYCKGNGRFWRYPSGALALYPSGPFCGREVPHV